MEGETTSVSQAVASDRSWCAKFKEIISPFSGLVNTVEEALDVVREYEIVTKTRFVSANKCKHFGKFVMQPGHKILWGISSDDDPRDQQLKYDGLPYVVLGNRRLECQHGPDRNRLAKQRRNNSKKEPIQSKKLDCPAKIIMKEIVKFPQHSISVNNKSQRRQMSKILRASLFSDNCDTQALPFIQVCLPEEMDHYQHLAHSTSVHQSMDDRLRQKLKSLVKEGVTNVKEMSRHLRSYAECELGAKDIDNLRFYPKDRDIKNAIYLASNDHFGSSKRLAKLAANCRDLLQQCTDITHKCTDMQALQHLKLFLSNYVTSVKVQQEVNSQSIEPNADGFLEQVDDNSVQPTPKQEQRRKRIGSKKTRPSVPAKRRVPVKRRVVDQDDEDIDEAVLNKIIKMK